MKKNIFIYQSFFKRVFDLVLSFVCLIIISPLFCLIYIFLLIGNSGSGVFFVQPRPGMNEKIFYVIKFKTMNDKKDSTGNLLSDKERLTSIGKIIRRLSLDEIPQLINVIKGDMSLVGPRPLLTKYLPYYTKQEKIRHSVRPGITGLAQINGRNNLNWDERLSKDIEYVHNISLLFDLKIIYQTILKVIKSENIVIDPESSMKNLDDERKNRT